MRSAAGPRRRAAALARREGGPLYAAVRRGLAARRLRAVPVTLAAVGLTGACYLLQHTPAGLGLVRGAGFVRAEDPLWLALLRTPLSLFVPALDLPVWGALAQILVVFGIAEIAVGRRALLGVAYLSTLAGSAYARIGVALGPDALLGLPAADARIADTGPSAAVVGVALWVCYRYRARLTGAAVVAAMAVEAAVKPNLAGKEHLAAIAAALVLCAGDALRQRRRQRSPSGALDSSARSGAPPPDSSERSGAPPIRSWRARRGLAHLRSWWTARSVARALARGRLR